MNQVWSNGGGTQSAAIAALIIKGELPKPDLAVTSDTGREASETWRFHDEVLGPELHQVRSAEAGVLFEGGQQPVRVPLVTLLRHDSQFHEMGHPTTEGIPQSTDPVTDLVGEDQVVVLGLKGAPAGLGLALENVAQPIRKLLVLFYLSNRQF